MCKIEGLGVCRTEGASFQASLGWLSAFLLHGCTVFPVAFRLLLNVELAQASVISNEGSEFESIL